MGLKWFEGPQYERVQHRDPAVAIRRGGADRYQRGCSQADRETQVLPARN